MGSAPGGAVGRVDRVLQDGGELGRPEGHPADLRVALDVDQVLRAQQHRQLAEVHLGEDDAVVAAQDVAEVGRHRVQVAQVDLGDRRPDRRIRRQAAPIGP